MYCPLILFKIVHTTTLDFDFVISSAKHTVY